MLWKTNIWKFCNFIKYVQTGGCYGVAKFNWSHTIIVICSIKPINLHIKFYLIFTIFWFYQILITVNKHNIAFNTKLLCNGKFYLLKLFIIEYIYAKGNRKFIYKYNKFQYIVGRLRNIGLFRNEHENLYK